MSFIDLQVTTDPTTLLDTGVDQVNATLTANSLPGWTANDASLAVIIMSVLAQWAADLGTQTSTLLDAAFRAFGTQLFGIPYVNPAAASTLTTWTFTAAAPVGGYFIPGGTTVLVDGLAFYTQADYTSGTGDTTATITLIASQGGVAYNGVGGVSIGAPRVVLVDAISFVSNVTTQGVSSGGVDQETDDDYQSRLASALTIYKLSVVNSVDYPVAVLSDVAENATGVVVGRATAIDLYYPDARVLSTGGAGSTAISASTTNGSPTVYYTTLSTQVPTIGATVTGTGIPALTTVAATPAPTGSSFTLSANATATGSPTLTIGALSGYGPQHLTATVGITSGSANVTISAGPYTGAVPDVGARVVGAGIPNGTTILGSPAPTSTTFTMSANATATTAGETATISSWTNVGRCVTTFVTDSAGQALSAANMDTLATWLAGLRETGFIAPVTAASYNTVYVTAVIHALPNYSSSSVATNVQAALENFLSPATWGNPGTTTTGSTSWLNSASGFATVRYLDLVSVAHSVPGVQYISSLKLGFTASPAGSVDLTMSGPAPLPKSDNTTILVTTV